MYLVEKHIINRNNSFYREVDELCFLAKNLYNRANYVVRQEFIGSTKQKEQGLVDHANYLNYYDINKFLKEDENYVALPRKVSNQVLMQLDKNWKSFFASIKDWGRNKEKYKGRPSLPKYKDKTKGRFGLEYELGAISTKELKKGFIKLSGTNISIPFINKECKLRCARITVLNGYYQIEVIYEKEEQIKKEDNGKYLGIDPGVNNLMALTSNAEGFKPLLINGRPIKSFNQYYNKRLSELQSLLPEGKFTSKRIKKMSMKRQNKIENYFHKAANVVINSCLQNDINTIVIGHNVYWKQNVNMGKKNNQKFVSIPYDKLFNIIKYKAELQGINVLLTEESFTSKASFLNQDFIPTYKKNDETEYEFSGYREHRGLYKIKGQKKYINADVNGSYNTIRKVFPNAFADGIQGFAVTPLKINLR